MILKIKVHTVWINDILANNSRFSSLFAAKELETSPAARSEEKRLCRLPISTALALFQKFKQLKPGKAKRQTKGKSTNRYHAS